MQGFQQPNHMGVIVQKHQNISPTENSVVRKIFLLLSEFMDWLAKGRDGNMPCIG